ncbi:MAG: GIY-YIG nuclease family protein [Solirubrobacteraceae bacterium]
MLAEDELGLLELPEKTPAPTPEDRLVAAYEEIAEFTRQHGRVPERNPADVGEFKLATRLEAMCADDEQRRMLEPVDELGLLREPRPPESIQEVIADDPLGLLGGPDELFELRHVPKTQTMPETIARRAPAKDFESFRQLFIHCHADLRASRRRLVPFKNPLEIKPERFFVQSGVLLYVAEIGELTYDEVRKANTRTRCIFENGTESRLLLQSLASNLYKDGKRVTIPDDETLAEMGLQADTLMASVYVLRSLSDDPQVRALPGLHKIGSTSSTASERVVGAASETTFLGAPVKIVAEYRVPRGAEGKIERMLHRLFAPARIDAWFERDGGTITEAREWFAVPSEAIEEAIGLIETEAIVNYTYDPSRRELRLKH